MPKPGRIDISREDSHPTYVKTESGKNWTRAGGNAGQSRHGVGETERGLTPPLDSQRGLKLGNTDFDNG